MLSYSFLFPTCSCSSCRLQWVLFLLPIDVRDLRPRQWQLVFHYIGASSAKPPPTQLLAGPLQSTYQAINLHLLLGQQLICWHFLASKQVWHDARLRWKSCVSFGPTSIILRGGHFTEWFIIVVGDRGGGLQGPIQQPADDADSFPSQNACQVSF